MPLNPAQQLINFGQSVWYDNISRDILQNGSLKKMIAEWGVRGLTSNPTIFDGAIKSSSIYDSTISGLKSSKASPDKIFEVIATEDIAQAADLFRPVYDESKGDDGFVSIEVSPLLAADTKGTIDEGLRLFNALKRPNIMIKVPGTSEGLPAVYALLEQGVNVNITLLFSVENYVKVANTYCEALRARLKKNLPIDKIRSVASFFVSRVDSSVDAKLEDIIKNSGDTKRSEAARLLLGKFGVANSRIAYQNFLEIFESNNFADLKAKGAKAQRPLWASTGTKNPAYSDVLYVEELIGPNTVNTIPHKTLEAVVDHCRVAETITKDISGAKSIGPQLAELGIDVKKVLEDLQVDGVKKFSESFVSLNKTIAEKSAKV